jgi:hypothetical protein
MATRRRSGAALGVWLCLSAAAAPAATIDVGSASGTPGSEVTIAVSLETQGAVVLGTENRIDFERATAVAALPSGQPDCSVAPAIHKNATGFRFLPLGCDPAGDCQSVRAIVVAFDNVDPIPDGAILYTCRIAIAADAAAGSYPLHNAETDASAAGGQEVVTTGTDGAVSVVPTPVASIDIGASSGAPGTTVQFGVTLSLLTDPPAAVGGLQNDIGFDAHTPIAVAPDGTPDCTTDPSQLLARFTFLPVHCTPGIDCTGVRAAIVSSDPTSFSIPDGATLYACNVSIAADTPPGTYPLLASTPQAADVLGTMLSVRASDGTIDVTPPIAPACVGDCDGDGVVAINELLIGVNIASGGAPVSACTQFDANGDHTVTVDEVIRAVKNALSGCSTG